MFDKARSRRDRPDTLLGKRRTNSSVLGWGLIAVSVLTGPAVARAQVETGASSAKQTSPATSILAITRPEVDAFADLLGETVENVLLRLSGDPGLVPIAAEAADVRLSRKSSGEAMTGAGFVLFGAGLTVSILTAVLSTMPAPGTCDSAHGECQDYPMSAEAQTISTVALVTAGLGLVLAIPGIVRMARQTDIETEAVDRYQRGRSGRTPIFPPGTARSLSGGSGGQKPRLPLLTFTF